MKLKKRNQWQKQYLQSVREDGDGKKIVHMLERQPTRMEVYLSHRIDSLDSTCQDRKNKNEKLEMKKEVADYTRNKHKKMCTSCSRIKSVDQ